MAITVTTESCTNDDYRTMWSTNPATDPVETDLPSNIEDYLPALEKKCQTVLDAAYMAENYEETNTDLSGWEGYPVKLYTYHTGTDKETGTAKVGKVYMLNPDAEKLAMWIATTCWEVKRSLDTKYTDQIVERVLVQSGGQFPVSGVVYEDMEGDGTYYPYIFKDGVTVYLNDESMKAADNNPTEAMLDYYLTLTDSQLKSYTGTYARIVGTTREEYKANGGTVDVGTSESTDTRKVAFLGVVRELYQKAWDTNYNELMIAWAAQNLE